jgi:hypothetical protein
MVESIDRVRLNLQLWHLIDRFKYIFLLVLY